MDDAHTTATQVLATCVSVFRSQQRLGERAFAQLSDEQLAASPGEGQNSVLVVMKHVAGNQRSRWTDFLTTDGEKASRRRDEEFEDDGSDPEGIREAWRRGWETLFAALAELTPDDLMREVRIRGEPHTVFEAILRQVSHYAYHVGQIVTLARLQAGERWTSLSIPRGQSEAFNRAKGHTPE